MSVDELVTAYAQGEAPTMDEMYGEFPSTLLNQGGLLNPVAQAAVKVGGWAFKAFRPGGEAGDGYNGFRRKDGVVRMYRMRTHIGPSIVDGGDAFHLDYRSFRSIVGMVGMYDELRRIGDGLYLGMGHMLRVTGKRVLPFALQAPATPWVGADLDEV